MKPNIKNSHPDYQKFGLARLESDKKNMLLIPSDHTGLRPLGWSCSIEIAVYTAISMSRSLTSILKSTFLAFGFDASRRVAPIGI